MKTTEKQNNQGYLAKVEMQDTTVLNIFTKAGKYRGGKVYFADKVFLRLSGAAKVTTYEGEEDVTRTYTSSDGLIKISRGIPNIFYFPEDTEMLEWFPKNVETDHYERYRELK